MYACASESAMCIHYLSVCVRVAGMYVYLCMSVLGHTKTNLMADFNLIRSSSRVVSIGMRTKNSLTSVLVVSLLSSVYTMATMATKRLTRRL